MRPNALGWFLIVSAIVLGVFGWRLFANDELTRWNNVTKVINAPSSIDLLLTIRYPKPPIYQEVYHLSDINGISKYSYSVRAYKGLFITVTQPKHVTYSVSVFFEELEKHGLWQLTNKAPRKPSDPVYTLHVAQSVGGQSGSRLMVFSDPHYWATTAARHFEIHLSRNQPVPNLLQLHGTSLLDPRYEAIVKAFRAFGPPVFRRDIRMANARARHA